MRIKRQHETVQMFKTRRKLLRKNKSESFAIEKTFFISPWRGEGRELNSDLCRMDSRTRCWMFPQFLLLFGCSIVSEQWKWNREASQETDKEEDDDKTSISDYKLKMLLSSIINFRHDRAANFSTEVHKNWVKAANIHSASFHSVERQPCCDKNF